MSHRGSLAGVAAGLSTFALACSGPPGHTPEPYASDAQAAAALDARATAYCSALVPSGDPQPTRAFVTDGCSLWPDRDWNRECCVTHDIAYWCGGTRKERKRADTEFGECVAANSSRPTGLAMSLGVRMGGHPVFPSSYRWGYGHDYRACYPSNPAQRDR